MTKTTNRKQPKIVLAGRAAIDTGRPLWVRALDGHWVPGSENTRVRALRMPPHATWIYGVEDA